MDISSYVLLSQEQALRRKLDVAANNMANMSTAGFKRERPVFREFVEQSTENAVEAARKTSFVLDYGAMHDTAAGSFQSTGNPMDVMIDGPGYLAVEAPDGGTAYTRAGFVKTNQAGELTTAGGQRILGEGGRPIAVPADQLATLTIGNDGTVATKDGPVGRIAVTVFDDERMVTPRGDGLMTASNGRELAAADTRLRNGGIEASNVEPIVETTQMVEILRAYQSSMKMSQDMDDLRRRAIDRLGKLG
ncbi:flagellar hook-basal body complex protein [Sphingomonas mollis]|uniref:Flagellar hook-basal body complex protein n=1 Tax=Sphingomonas mollis TaxID=2795726 RepID=A0ABS0XPY8_9SPHN|nr:flagellar hook-basal body complex protein [Sphingomonas sp. BT553]MBJ6122111.1 flagellar hook-basal body complex protein [Sphingomonas sp. BT553]